MPIYEYVCEKCSFKFELLKNVGEDGGAPCPKCQGHSRRIFSRISYVWKGTRFAGEKIIPQESSKPKNQSENKAENDKNPRKSKENDKSTPPTPRSEVERNETNQ